MVYVDDLLLLTPNSDERQLVKRQIAAEFKIRDLGPEPDSGHEDHANQR